MSQALPDDLRGHNRPPPDPLIPERLLDPAAIAPLLDANYGALVERGAELLDAARAWQADLSRTTITTQDAADALADFMQQLDRFAHPKTGEVEAARQRVKGPVFEAGRAIDRWFHGKHAEIQEIVGNGAAGPGPGTMQNALTAWSRAEAARRKALADQEARRLAEEAAAAIRAAQDAAGDEEAETRSLVAEDTADRAAAQAQLPDRAFVAHRTARDTGVTLRDAWKFRLTSMAELVLAAALPYVLPRLTAIPEIGGSAALQAKIIKALTPAGGAVPLDYLETAGSRINVAIKGANGRRECPGLEIYNDAQAQRRA